MIDDDFLAAGVDPSRDDGLSVLDRTKAARPGNILSGFGDYELLEEIGRGGQGVVYRARQKSLNRTVALKVVGLGSWATEAHLKRFRREAEAAGSLNHSCIVPIYEVGERDGACYFSMGLVEGEQLDAILKCQPMPIRRAVELIAKVARTVHYAHEHGILHRDVKPGNILLDQNGEPHLTDFGLARLVEAESTVTGTLEVLGTPSYMAPEQAAGETKKLGKATDVYGLGAVLYQLLTGQPPFAGGTTYETIRLLRDTEPRQPRVLNPKVDRDLSTICLKCLEKDPQRRYSSALGVAEDLEHWLKHEPIQAKPSGFFIHGRKWVRRNPSTAILVAVLVAFAIGLSVTVWNRRPAVVIPKSVAVLPFENLSPYPDSTYLADGIQEEILTRLAKIADLRVISHTSTQHYQSKPRNVGEIAKQLGVANVLEGSVQKIADQVRINVRLVNAQTDSHLWADTYDRKFTDIFGIESEISKRIAHSLQVKLSGREEKALEVKPTNNPDAYDAYLRGLSVEARNYSTAYSRDLLEKTAGFYERAVQLDPNFAVAWAQLSRTDAHLYFNDDHTAARRDGAKIDLENAQKLEPDSPETLLALGYYQYWVLRDYGSATTTFNRVRKMVPGNSDLPMALGRVARREGHWDENVAYFEQAITLDPRNIELLVDTAWTYAMLRQFPAAVKLYDRALDITPNNLDVTAVKACCYQAQGDLQQAASLLTEINSVTPVRDTFFAKITQLRLERNYSEAIRLLQSRLAQLHPNSSPQVGDVQVQLSLTQRLAGDAAGAKATAEQARNTLEHLCREQPDNDGFATRLSLAYAVMGEKNSALKLAEATIASFSNNDRVSGPDHDENLVFIQMIFGDTSGAISTLTRLLQTPYVSWFYRPMPVTPALLRLDPIWDPLRSDPAFQKLCEEKVDRSVAVLPFENLSGDPDNAYFAEGIQEEILTRLAKIADLKVISRTSTSRYKSKPDDIGEIAKQLGVANIVEGSVQKAASQVRVNVQLINAQADSHLWADTYDRKLTDILGIESEIAKRIAKSLQAKLTGREEQALTVKPTSNPEAYDAYLRGMAFQGRSFYSGDALGKAIQFFEQAVQLDPSFGLAWARLSRAHAWELHIDQTAFHRNASKKALDNAQKLAPNSPETLLALGYYQRFVLYDGTAAKSTFKGVGEMLPGNSEAPYALGRIARNEGQWDESNAYFEQALSLDPRNVELLAQAAENYTLLRQFPAALKLYDHALDIVPKDPDLMAEKAAIYQAQGNLQEAAKFLSEVGAQASMDAFYTKITQLRLERNYAEAIHLLETRLAQFKSPSEMERGDDLSMLPFLQHLTGDNAAASLTAKQARDTLQALCKAEPAFDSLQENLALANAVIGEKDSALKASERLVMIGAEDRVNGPTEEQNLAIIQTIVGEKDRAISILARLLRTPYYGGNRIYTTAPITPALLGLDPIWDPLRADPAFQKLCKEKQPLATP